MAPLAHTLALLAMTLVATAAMDTLPMDMAWDSFDDQYLQCSAEMSEKFPKLQSSDFKENGEFKENWKEAMSEWHRRGYNSSPLTPDEAVALMAYTMMDTKLRKQFNDAMGKAGSSSKKYWNEFHFKSLHFLLTQALQKLRPENCKIVYRGVRNYHFELKKDDEVRAGHFALTSLSETAAQGFGQGTEFKVHTCHGADIQKFSKYPEQKEVLIPPFEKFRVTDVRKEGNTMYIELKSTGTFSKYDCGSLKGRSLIMESPNLSSKAANLSTNASNLPTNAPNLPSKATNLPSKAPNLPTNAPNLPSKAPNLPSKAPNLPSKAPNLPSKAPNLPTNASNLPSNASHVTSNSPHLTSNSPHLGGLLLATVAMAVVTGTL